jgi:hypothetical protein
MRNNLEGVELVAARIPTMPLTPLVILGVKPATSPKGYTWGANTVPSAKAIGD